MSLMSPSGILEFPKFTQAPKTARASNWRFRFDKERGDHAANIAFFAIYVKPFSRTVLITGSKVGSCVSAFRCKTDIRSTGFHFR
jgi:hypothetical protein